VSRRVRTVVVALLATTVVAMLAARWAWGLDAVQDFVARYPGVPAGAEHVGTPGWVVVLHAMNLFFMALIVRSGLAIRAGGRPAGRWTRRGRPRLSKKKRPTTITVEQWFHVSLDLLWLTAGAVFVVLLFTSGRWVRLIPTSVDVIPHAASVALQMLALHWPTESTWVAYNALQMLAYAGVVFVLAPLAAITGLRQSALWPTGRSRLDRVFSVERAHALHHPVMVAFVAFVVVHVAMVLATGALRNLNHMFASRDDTSPLGLVVVLAVLALAAAAWYATTRPVWLRALGALFGKVTR